MPKIKYIAVLIFLLYSKLILAQSTIEFSGISWNVRSGVGGPGPNNWSDNPKNVWVDSLGRLHLKITKEGNTWYCSEIYTQQSIGYGKYLFYLAENPLDYDPNIVVGLFTYESDTKEIDIEFSQWADTNSLNGWYTVQPPPYNNSNQNSFSANLKKGNTTHKFNWSADSIHFQSYSGNYRLLPSPDSLINEWTYSGNSNPPAGNERLHINFWLFKGNMPQNQLDAELVVNAVFVPSGSLSISILPLEVINKGAKWNVDNGPWLKSDSILASVTDGYHTIRFNDVSGWSTPLSRNIKVDDKIEFHETVNYSIINTITSKPEIPKLDIFPIPVDDFLHLVELVPSNGIKNITVCNSMGQIILSTKINNSKAEINVSSFKEGLYYLDILLIDNTVVKKCFIKR
ncbi:MAG: T9SS type A sorting domain-containing protein [Salinivirgaceae bacterium]|jgi:hypothetical protein